MGKAPGGEVRRGFVRGVVRLQWLDYLCFIYRDFVPAVTPPHMVHIIRSVLLRQVPFLSRPKRNIVAAGDHLYPAYNQSIL